MNRIAIAILALSLAVPAFAEDMATKPPVAPEPLAAAKPATEPAKPIFPMKITFPAGTTIAITARGKVAGDLDKAQKELATMTGQGSMDAAIIAYIVGQEKAHHK